MSNSRLMISNQKIKLIENRNSLQIKKGKLILNEDVTDVSTEQAFSMVTDTGKSLLNIGQGIVKMYLSQVKMNMGLLLTPLTGNLSGVISSYEQDINEVNRLFLESIPSNVQKTSQLINISNNASTFVFKKVFENLEKVEGIEKIINAQNIKDILIPPPFQKIFDEAYNDGKEIVGGLWQLVTKDLPEFFKLETSSYSSLDKESYDLKLLYDELNDSFGEKESRGISGLKIDKNQIFEKFATAFVNAIRTANIVELKNQYNFAENDEKNNFAIDNIVHILTNSTKNSIDKNYSASNVTWNKKVAEKSPAPSENIVRFNLDCKIEIYITIKKEGANNYDIENCKFAFDNGENQTTEDYDFSSFFN